MNTFKIKMGIFKNYTIEDLVKITKLDYGALDAGFALETGVIKQYTIIFDHTKIGRGVELSLDKRNIIISSLIPNTIHDIKMTYDIIEKICNSVGTKVFYKNETKCTLDQMEELIKDDIKLSQDAIEDYTRKFYLKIYSNLNMICATNQIFFGETEMDIIDNSLENFEEMLHKYQSMGLILPKPKFYSNESGRLVAIYDIYEEEKTLLSKKVMDRDNTGRNISNYVCIPDLNLMPYNDFIECVEQERYDEESIIVKLNEKSIKTLLKKNIVDINTDEPIPKKERYYFGHGVDFGYQHAMKVKRMHLATDELNGYSHIAAFICYAHKMEWLSDNIYKASPKLKETIETNGDIRTYIKKSSYFEGGIKIGIFKKEIQDFIKSFYIFNNSNGYPSCVDDNALKYFGEEKYNSKEFQDEAYLFMEWNQEYIDNMGKYIEKAYKKYEKTKNSKK